MKNVTRAAVLATATALALAACGAAPEDEPTGTAGPGETTAWMRFCGTSW